MTPRLGIRVLSGEQVCCFSEPEGHQIDQTEGSTLLKGPQLNGLVYDT